MSSHGASRLPMEGLNLNSDGHGFAPPWQYGVDPSPWFPGVDDDGLGAGGSNSAPPAIASGPLRAGRPMGLRANRVGASGLSHSGGHAAAPVTTGGPVTPAPRARQGRQPRASAAAKGKGVGSQDDRDDGSRLQRPTAHRVSVLHFPPFPSFVCVACHMLNFHFNRAVAGS